MIGGAIVLDYHKGSAMMEMDDPRVKLGGGYVVSDTQLNTSTWNAIKNQYSNIKIGFSQLHLTSKNIKYSCDCTRAQSSN